MGALEFASRSGSAICRFISLYVVKWSLLLLGPISISYGTWVASLQPLRALEPWLGYSQPPHTKTKGVSLLTASTMSQGASVGPLIDLAIRVDPSCVIFSNLESTALIFSKS